MLIKKELGKQIEHCIEQSHYYLTREYSAGAALSVGSGSAFYSGIDSFFTQVINWGFDISTSKQFVHEIEMIENFYRRYGHPQVDIELCPLVGNHVASQLSQRGYQVSEMNNIQILNLEKYKPAQLTREPYFIQPLHHEEDLTLWAETVSKGFHCTSEKGHFLRYAKAKGVRPFAAYINEKMAAGGTIAIYGTICDLGVTSTLPGFRDLGLQKALLQKRLQYALDAGVKLAVVTTEPGSISDLNVQKMGFKQAYTRIKFIRQAF